MKLLYWDSRTKEFKSESKRFHNFGQKRRNSSRVPTKSYCSQKVRENMHNRHFQCSGRMLRRIKKKILFVLSILITLLHSRELWRLGMRKEFRRSRIKIKSCKSYTTILYKLEIFNWDKQKWIKWMASQMRKAKKKPKLK